MELLADALREPEPDAEAEPDAEGEADAETEDDILGGLSQKLLVGDCFAIALI